MTVAPDVASACRNCRPSAAVSRLAKTTRAPTMRGRKSSNAAMSNDVVVTASSTSFAVNPGSACMEARKLTSDRCVISTPFGRPVDPDV